jgi:PiT family inorganic phosphate transporter
MVSNGPGHVLWGVGELLGPSHEVTGIVKVAVFLLISPVLGFVLAFLLEKLSILLLRRAKYSLNRGIKHIQWLISALLAYSHGANDTQKIIGLIALALASAGGTPLSAAPLWVRFCGGAVMFVGTALGGWSIMKTIGRRIYKLRPIHSLNSQLSAAFSVFAANLFGAPVSTTHVVVGSVMGVGAADQFKRVNWSTAREIVVAWVITIPLAAGVSAVTYCILSFFFVMM